MDTRQPTIDEAVHIINKNLKLEQSKQDQIAAWEVEISKVFADRVREITGVVK